MLSIFLETHKSQAVGEKFCKMLPAEVIAWMFPYELTSL